MSERLTESELAALDISCDETPFSFGDDRALVSVRALRSMVAEIRANRAEIERLETLGRCDRLLNQIQSEHDIRSLLTPEEVDALRHERDMLLHRKFLGATETLLLSALSALVASAGRSSP